jgi:hypothetical protein
MLKTQCRALLLLGLITVSMPSARAQNPPKLRPLDSSGLLTYYIAEGIPTFGSRDGDNELATWAFKEWERRAGGAIRLEPIADEGTALIRLYWQSWTKGQYGQAKPHIANRRWASIIYVRPNTHAMHKTLGPVAAKDRTLRDVIVYLTCLHEIGHALGLGHSASPDDIMRDGIHDSKATFERYRQRVKSRGEIATTAWLSETDAARLRERYAPEP